MLDEAERTAYGRSALNWPAFPAATTALLYLQKYVKLVALTDVNSDTFAASSEKLTIQFDAVVAVEADDVLRSVRNWVERLRAEIVGLGAPMDGILYVTGESSQASRAVQVLGLADCRIDRGRAKRRVLPPENGQDCEFGFANMAELVIAHQEAVRAP